MDESSKPKPAAKGKKAITVPKISTKTAVVGAAIGIGSAAIVAALLYTNRSNKN